MGISHVTPRPAAAESAGCQPGFHIRPHQGRVKVPCRGQMVVLACVERPILRTTWTILDATCAENVLVRTGIYIAWK